MSPAWEWILQNWGCVEWQPIPQWIKIELRLHPALGICGGMLITRRSAVGIIEFIIKMNRKRG